MKKSLLCLLLSFSLITVSLPAMAESRKSELQEELEKSNSATHTVKKWVKVVGILVGVCLVSGIVVGYAVEHHEKANAKADGLMNQLHAKMNGKEGEFNPWWALGPVWIGYKIGEKCAQDPETKQNVDDVLAAANNLGSKTLNAGRKALGNAQAAIAEIF